MDLDNTKHVYCNSVQQTSNTHVLSASRYGRDMLYISFFRGDLCCSNVISKDEAHKFAENILKLLEETAAPNPQPIDCPQMEVA